MSETTSPSKMQYSAYAAAALGVLQFLLGGVMISNPGGLSDVHNSFGLLAIVAAGYATFTTFRWRQAGGNPGLFPHAAGMTVVAFIQYALGEMIESSGSTMRTIHIVLGLVYLVGIVGLATLAHRKPGTATAS